MELTEAIYRRRAVREFADERVPETVLRDLIDAAIQAPSAVNRQPWLFTVIERRPLLEEISKEAKRYMLQSAEVRGSAHFSKVLQEPGFDIFYGAPALIVISVAENGPWALEDCALAAENLMLAAFAAGLGTCWIGFAQAWLGTAEGRVRIGLSPAALPVAPIIVGYPKRPAAPVPRKAPVIQWIT